ELNKAGCRRALHDVGIEAVERAENRGVQRAALGRIGVHIIVALEVLAIFGAAGQRRTGVPLIRLRARRQNRNDQTPSQYRRLDMVKVHSRPFAALGIRTHDTVPNSPDEGIGLWRSCRTRSTVT